MLVLILSQYPQRGKICEHAANGLVCVCVWLFGTPWTMDCSSPDSSVHGIFQARKEYWSGLPFPTPEDLPDPGIKLNSLASPALADGFFTTSATFSRSKQMYLMCQKKYFFFFFSYSQISFSVTNNINITKRLLNVFLIWLHQTQSM